MIMLGISAARGPWITFEKADSGICEVKKNFFCWGLGVAGVTLKEMMSVYPTSH